MGRNKVENKRSKSITVKVDEETYSKWMKKDKRRRNNVLQWAILNEFIIDTENIDCYMMKC